MRSMEKGELCLIYHTGDERQAVGIAEITKTVYPDPKLDDPKRLVFDIKPKKKLKAPVTIADIKADSFFNDWLFVRIGRLSVVPVTDEQWERLIKMAGS